MAGRWLRPVSFALADYGRGRVGNSTGWAWKTPIVAFVHERILADQRRGDPPLEVHIVAHLSILDAPFDS
jgi:hypothetical protein